MNLIRNNYVDISSGHSETFQQLWHFEILTYLTILTHLLTHSNTLSQFKILPILTNFPNWTHLLGHSDTFLCYSTNTLSDTLPIPLLL